MYICIYIYTIIYILYISYIESYIYIHSSYHSRWYPLVIQHSSAVQIYVDLRPWTTRRWPMQRIEWTWQRAPRVWPRHGQKAMPKPLGIGFRRTPFLWWCFTLFLLITICIHTYIHIYIYIHIHMSYDIVFFEHHREYVFFSKTARFPRHGIQWAKPNIKLGLLGFPCFGELLVRRLSEQTCGKLEGFLPGLNCADMQFHEENSSE